MVLRKSGGIYFPVNDLFNNSANLTACRVNDYFFMFV